MQKRFSIAAIRCGFTAALVAGCAAQPGATAVIDAQPPGADLAIEKAADSEGLTACAADPGAAQSTFDPPRRALPWTVILAGPDSGDGGVGSGDGGAGQDGGAAADAAAGSRCARLGNVPIGCSGSAVVASVESQLELRFDDGARMVFTPTGIMNPVGPPPVANGDRVWVAYTFSLTPVCPFCGAYSTASLTLSRGMGGPILWMGQEGHLLDDLTASQSQALFGVGFHTRPRCQLPVSGRFTCSTAERTEYDHIIETPTADTIAHATVKKVSTPNGTFEVFWASSTETIGPVPGCADGGKIAHDTAFAASRTTLP